jgi:hypothetical protein
MSLILAPQLAFALCAAALLVMTVPGFLLYRRFLRDLRLRHPEAWERLGRPTVVYYSSQQARRELSRWVAEDGFDALSDPDFAADCRRYRAYGRVYGAVFTGLWILFALIVGLRLALTG